MNHNFYKRAICLLLASSVTFGPAVGPLSAHALEELSTQMADQMAELTPAQSSSSVPMMELTPAQSTESETPEKTEDAVDKEEKPQDSAEQDEQSKLPEQESPVFTGKNLAQEQEVQVSASHTAQGSDAEHARDGESGSAWTAKAKDGQASLSYDFQEVCALEGVHVQWESADTIKEYFVETSVNGTAWDVQAHRTSTQKEERILFKDMVEAQHVRLRLVTTEAESVVGVQEFAVYGNKKPAVLTPVQPAAALPAGTNLARQEGVIATESDVEDGTDFNADKARDGDRTSKSSRWATDQNVQNPTITYDLGQTRTIGGVVIYWEQSSASHYFIETSTDGNDWKVQKELNKKADNLVEKIDFDNAVQAQHIRVRVQEYSSASWNNVAMYEFEVYQEKPSTIKDASSVAESIKPREENGKLVYDTTDGFDIT
ncbi:MAG: discoidin domain-containing protein, partial [Butyricicoccus pullicaecorum]|nr:discoidin domain-containing protein [Butyricicoccus pullicaecorum]